MALTVSKPRPVSPVGESVGESFQCCVLEDAYRLEVILCLYALCSVSVG